MKIKEINHLNIELTDNDVNDFKSIIDKLHKNLTPIGFTKSPYTDDEQSLIKKLYKDIKQ